MVVIIKHNGDDDDDDVRLLINNLAFQVAFVQHVIIVVIY